MTEETKMDFDLMDKLIKALKNPPIVKVGILGDGRKREDGALTNATVGLAHEFGSAKLPMRSFLRMPLITRLEKNLRKSDLLSPESVRNILKTASFTLLVQRIGIEAEGTIADAFDSGGFGVWPKSNMTYKKVHQTLVETQQLRNSITSEIEEQSA